MAKHHGTTLIEILIAIALAGLLAVLAIPKFINTQSEMQSYGTSSSTGKVEQIMEQLSVTYKGYQSANDQSVNLSQWSYPNNHPYEYIFQNNGNYFAFKLVHAANPTIQYFLLPDGSRLTARPELFASVDTLPEYNVNNTPPLANQWAGLLAPPAGTQSQYCGDYNQLECMYIDINGKNLPNAIGKNGDIVPIRIDSPTGKIKTLYEWELQTNPHKACNYVSFYDVATYGANCP